MAPTDGIICGLRGKFNGSGDSYPDRSFKYQVCRPPTSGERVTRVQHTSFDFKHSFIFTCPEGSALQGIHGQYFDNSKLWSWETGTYDRRWTLDCYTYRDHTFDMCYWMDWVNIFGQDEFIYEAGFQHVIAGIESQYQLSTYDRRYRFRVCRMIRQSAAGMADTTGSSTSAVVANNSENEGYIYTRCGEGQVCDGCCDEYGYCVPCSDESDPSQEGKEEGSVPNEKCAVDTDCSDITNCCGGNGLCLPCNEAVDVQDSAPLKGSMTPKESRGHIRGSDPKLDEEDAYYEGFCVDDISCSDTDCCDVGRCVPCNQEVIKKDHEASSVSLMQEGVIPDEIDASNDDKLCTIDTDCIDITHCCTQSQAS